MNYYGKFRTSYFKPRNMDELREWIRRFGGDVQLFEQDPPHGDLVMLSSADSENGIPSSIMVEDGAESWDAGDVNFISELAEHIHPEWLVEIHQVGSEGLRYLTADAWLVGSDGIVDQMFFAEFTSECRDHATAAGKNLTLCQY